MPKSLRQYALFAAFVILACSSSGGDEGGGSAADGDGTASLATCTDTCDHLYNDCGLEMVDNTDTALSESECVDSCDSEVSEVVDCLDESDCTDVDEVNNCFLLGAEDECASDTDCDAGEVCTSGSCVAESAGDECTSDSDCDSSNNEECVSGNCIEQECNSDSDCGSCERCSSGSCIDCGEGPFGCYC